MPDSEWPADDAQRRVILADFAPAPVGDRRQEIVFIGVSMDEVRFALLCLCLCLLRGRAPGPHLRSTHCLPSFQKQKKQKNNLKKHTQTNKPGQDLGAARRGAAERRGARALRGQVGRAARPRARGRALRLIV